MGRISTGIGTPGPLEVGRASYPWAEEGGGSCSFTLAPFMFPVLVVIFEKELIEMSETHHSGLDEPLLGDDLHPILRHDEGGFKATRSHASYSHEAPPGLIAYEHTHSDLFEKGAHWLQVRVPT